MVGMAWWYSSWIVHCPSLHCLPLLQPPPQASLALAGELHFEAGKLVGGGGGRLCSLPEDMLLAAGVGAGAASIVLPALAALGLLLECSWQVEAGGRAWRWLGKVVGAEARCRGLEANGWPGEAPAPCSQMADCSGGSYQESVTGPRCFSRPGLALLRQGGRGGT